MYSRNLRFFPKKTATFPDDLKAYVHQYLDPRSIIRTVPLQNTMDGSDFIPTDCRKALENLEHTIKFSEFMVCHKHIFLSPILRIDNNDIRKIIGSIKCFRLFLDDDEMLHYNNIGSGGCHPKYNGSWYSLSQNWPVYLKDSQVSEWLMFIEEPIEVWIEFSVDIQIAHQVDLDEDAFALPLSKGSFFNIDVNSLENIGENKCDPTEVLFKARLTWIFPDNNIQPSP